jgi:hypothetical protein
MSNETPASIIAELRALTVEAAKGPQAVFNAEQKVAECELAYDTAKARAVISSSGTALEREAQAKLASADEKFALDLAKAEQNRIKLKLRQLESAQVSISVISRLVELEWRVTR